MKASIKKTVLISLATLAFLLLLGATGLYFYFNSQFIVYQDTMYNFSIKCPKTWSIKIHPYQTVAVIFMRPKDTALDVITENFNVTVQPVPDEILNLGAYTATIKKQLSAVFGKNIKFVEDKPLMWGWREGHMIAIDTAPPDHIKIVCAWVFRSNQAYIMTYFGDKDKYGKDGLFVNEMIRSLQLQ